MAPTIVLCVCGHAHFSGSSCWCGCSIFTPDVEDDPAAAEVDDDEYPVGQVTI